MMSDEKHDDFQNKYVGFVILWLVIGVFGTGVLGLIYWLNWAPKCPLGMCQ